MATFLDPLASSLLTPKEHHTAQIAQSNGMLDALRRSTGGTIPPFPLSLPMSKSDLQRWEETLLSSSSSSGKSKEASTTSESEPPLLVLQKMFPGLASGSETSSHAAAPSLLCPIPLFQPSAVAQKSAVKGLAHRTKWLPYRQKVPAYVARSSLLAAVRDHPVLVVTGGRHTGKSTQLPQLFAETELFRKKQLIVVCATPFGAHLLARRLQEEKGETAPAVACTTAAVYECTSATQLAVTTYDVFLRVLHMNPTLSEVGCVMLDDLDFASTHSIYPSLVMQLLRTLVQTNPSKTGGSSNQQLRVVLSCRDESTATSLQGYFSQLPSSVATTAAATESSSASLVTSIVIPSAAPYDANLCATYYLDEACQWIERCTEQTEAGGGSGGAEQSLSLCTDPHADLEPYRGHVQAKALMLAAEEFDVGSKGLATIATYWGPLVAKLLLFFTKASRNTDMYSTGTAAPFAVVIVPNAAVGDALYRCLQDEEFIKEETLLFAPLCDVGAPHAAVLTSEELSTKFRLVQELLGAESLPASSTTTPSESGAVQLRQRVAIVTSDVAQSVLPLRTVNCVIDFARSEWTALDPQMECDRVGLQLCSRAELRAHRTILHYGGGGASHTNTAAASEGGKALPPLTIFHLVSRTTTNSRRVKATLPHPLSSQSLSHWMDTYLHCWLLSMSQRTAAAEGAGATLSFTAANAAAIGKSALSQLWSGGGTVATLPLTTAGGFRLDVAQRCLGLSESLLLAQQCLATPAAGAANKRKPQVSHQLTMTVQGGIRFALVLRSAVSRLLTLGGAVFGDRLSILLAAVLQTPTSDLFESPSTRKETEQQLLIRSFFSRFSSRRDLAIEGEQAERADEEDDHDSDAAEKRLTASQQYGDVNTLFNAYASWRYTALKQQQTDETLFLQNAQLSKARLAHVQQLYGCFVGLLQRTGLLTASQADTTMSLTALDEECCAAVAARRDLLHTITRVVANASLSTSLALMGGSPGQQVLFKNELTQTRPTAHVLPVTAVNAPSSILAAVPPEPKEAGEELVVVGPRPGLFMHAQRTAGLSSYASSGNSHAHATLAIATTVSLPALSLFSGAFEVTERAAPRTRCRGWSAPLSDAWRHTKAARLLPPAPQITTRAVPGCFFNPEQGDHPLTVSVTSGLQVQTTKHSVEFLETVRKAADRSFDAIATNRVEQWQAQAGHELIKAVQWMESRQCRAASWLRERRALASGVVSEEAEANPAGLPALLPYLTFPVGYDRPQRVQGVHQSSSSSVVAAAPSQQEVSVTKNVAAAPFVDSTPRVEPPADEALKSIIHQTAQTVAATGNRSLEATLMGSSPMFGFLDPNETLHAYYVQVLKELAPDMEWFGDDLDDLETWLKNLEVRLKAEAAGVPVPSFAMEDSSSSSTTGKSSKRTRAGDAVAAPAQQTQVIVDDVDEQQYWDEKMKMHTQSHAAFPQGGATSSSSTTQQGYYGGGPSHSSGMDIGYQKPQLSQHGAANSARLPRSFADGIAAPPPPLPGSSAEPGPSSSELRELLGLDDDLLLGDNMDATAVTFPPVGGEGAAGPLLADDGGILGDAFLPDPTSATYPLSTPPIMNSFDSAAAPFDPFLHHASMLPPFLSGPMMMVGGNSSSGAPLFPPPPPEEHPLAKPPPPIPADVIANRAPSVLVFPLPPREGGNIPLILAKALGETMNIKVGPTVIVGDVARIEVPNSRVELRALSLKQFICLGHKINIVRNDRVIDNPHHRSAKFQTLKAKLRDDHPRHLQRVEYSPERQDEADGGAAGGGEPSSYRGGRGGGYRGRGGRGGYGGNNGGYGGPNPNGADGYTAAPYAPLPPPTSPFGTTADEPEARQPADTREDF